MMYGLEKVTLTKTQVSDGRAEHAKIFKMNISEGQIRLSGLETWQRQFEHVHRGTVDTLDMELPGRRKREKTRGYSQGGDAEGWCYRSGCEGDEDK